MYTRAIWSLPRRPLPWFIVISFFIATSLGACDCNDDDDDLPTNDVGNDVIDNDVIDVEQTQLQLIHNAADPQLESVDVYVNGTLWASDLNFRSATTFVELDVDDTFVVAVAGSNSESAQDAVATFTLSGLEENRLYVGVLSGVLEPDEFIENPGEADTQLNLYLFENARNQAVNEDAAQALIFHGVTDAPAVNLVLADESNLAENLAYSEFTTIYLNIPQGVTAFDVMTTDDEQRLGSFQTPDIQGGEALVIVASGFADPAQKVDAPFGLWAFPATAEDNGERIEGVALERAARVQLVHLSPDPDASPVDVYFNEEQTRANLEYLDATPFLTVPSGVDLQVDIVAAGNENLEEAALSQTVQFEAGSTNAVIAAGVVNTDNFEDSPDGRDIELSLFTTTVAREQAASEEEVDVVVFHGVPDAPQVDAIIDELDPIAELGDNLGFGEFSERSSLEPATYEVKLTEAEDRASVLASFAATLAERPGEFLLIAVTGLLQPATEQPGLGMHAFSPQGETLELDVIQEPQPPVGGGD